jgi:hypothetical protein
VAEQVGRGHADAQPRIGQRLLEARDDPLAFLERDAPRDQVVVMQRDAPGAELGELVDGIHGVDELARRTSERVAAGVAHGPESESEAMARRHEAHATAV